MTYQETWGNPLGSLESVIMAILMAFLVFFGAFLVSSVWFPDDWSGEE